MLESIKNVEKEARQVVSQALLDEDVIEFIYMMTNATTADNVRTIARIIANPEEWEVDE